MEIEAEFSLNLWDFLPVGFLMNPPKAFEDYDNFPDDILWRYKLQYTQGLGCESLGNKLAESEISDDEYERIKAENPKAVLNNKEAAYYFKIFRQFHPQDSVLGSIGIWTGFDFEEEREHVRGTVDGDLKHRRPYAFLHDIDLLINKFVYSLQKS